MKIYKPTHELAQITEEQIRVRATTDQFWNFTPADIDWKELACYLEIPHNYLRYCGQEYWTDFITFEEFQRVYLPGSIRYQEAAMIFALLKTIQRFPSTLLELGSFIGISTGAIYSAKHDTDKLISVDLLEPGVVHKWHMCHIVENLEYDYLASRNMALQENITDDIEIVVDDVAHYMIDVPDESVDFIFEDSAHTEPVTTAIIREAKRVLKPGGLIVSHDGYMPEVFAGYTNNLPAGELFRNNTTTLLLWRKP